jgi:hypothetical protein
MPQTRNQVQVGHSGGEADLLSRDLLFAENKAWKWRDPKKNPGVIDPKNWLNGDRWLQIVESGHGFKG